MLCLTVSCFTASAASTESNKRAVFDFLTGEAGFNSAAACGIMANIEHESNFNPTTVARDRNGLLSGGLCMWNGSRFRNLQNYCNKNGYNYLSVEGQLRYLLYELKTDYFKHIYNYMKNVGNSASGAYNAAYYWCYYFEVPGNRAAQSVKRGNSARDKYWPAYGKKSTASKPAEPAPTPELKLSCSASGKTVDIGSKVTFSWSGSSSSVGNYYLYLKKPGQSSYSKISVNGSRKYTLTVSGKEAGTYKAYVIGKKSDGNTVGKASKTVSFTAKCLEHNFVKTSAQKPTKTENGKTVYTCKKCSAKKNVTVLSYNKQNLNKSSVDSFKSTLASSNTITLKWSEVSDADGYFLFLRSGDSWKLVRTLGCEDKSYCVSGLRPGTSYKFRVRAYAGSAQNKKNRVLSGSKTVTASTAPASPEISRITSPAKGQALIQWNKVKNADGYMLYYSYTKNGIYRRIATVSANETSYHAKALLSGSTVYFKVKAYSHAKSYTAYSGCGSVKSKKIK